MEKLKTTPIRDIFWQGNAEGISIQTEPPTAEEIQKHLADNDITEK